MNKLFDPAEYINKRTEDTFLLIKNRVNILKDNVLKNKLFKILEDPTLSILPEISKKEIKSLSTGGLLKDEKELELFLESIKRDRGGSFLNSPGSIKNGHHSYPGGLVYHTAVNIEIALSMADIYQSIYGLQIDRDLLITALILHDIAKATIFSWDHEGNYADEVLIAGTEAHHILSIGEAMKRKFPFPVIKAMAFCHIALPSMKEDLRRYLNAADILSGGISTDCKFDHFNFSLEDFICYFADSEVSLAEWSMNETNNRMKNNNMNLFEKYQQLSVHSEFAIFKN